MLDEITYPFPNFKSATVEIWEWEVIVSGILLGMWLFIHTGIKVKYAKQNMDSSRSILQKFSNTYVTLCENAERPIVMKL